MEFLKKANYLLLFFIAALVLMYFLSSLFIPMAFGIFLAMLIVPLSSFLEKHKFNRVLSSLVSTLVLFILSGLFFYMFIYQVNEFAQELPDVQEELHSAIERFQREAASTTGESEHDMPGLDTVWEFVESNIAGFIGGVVTFAFNFFIVFVYLFLLLLYRDKFLNFFSSFYSDQQKEANAREALEKIGKVVYHYLWGRLQVMLTLAVMYYTTFLIFGLPYALLITLFGALITIIPYIGPLVSGLVPISFALVYFDDYTTMLLFVICIITIQLIESYVIEPFLIGKELRLNALTVIFAVILGGIVWGIAGMILFVPIFATIKIISNHSDGMKPFGNLLGQ